MTEENKISRLRILELYKILNMYTDEEHPMPGEGLCAKLSEYGIKCERKTLYRDIGALKASGVDILYTHTPKTGYFIGERDFEPPEVRLLTDAVRSAPFITNKKTAELTAKLKSLLSVWQADETEKQVHVENLLKYDNEEIYYAIYTVSRAIGQNKKISFTYHHHVIEGNKAVLDSGRKFTISPYALIWNSDKYYIAGNYQKYDSISVYRIDKMRHTEMRSEPSRPFQEVSVYKESFDAADFARRTFHMYSGEKRSIVLRCMDGAIEIILDRFGNDVRINSKKDGTFTVCADVYVSEGLMEWLLQYGDRIAIVSPQELRLEMVKRIGKINNIYNID